MTRTVRERWRTTSDFSQRNFRTSWEINRECI